MHVPKGNESHKNEINQGGSEDVQEVGLAHSTDEVCESTWREGANIEIDFK